MKTALKMPVLAALASLFFLQSCDWAEKSTGDLMTDTFHEKDFHGLEICTPGKVEVRVDSVFSIEITAEESALPHIETSVSGGILKIEFDKNLYDVDDLKIKVAAPAWDEFIINGSCKLLALDAISGNKLRLEVSGSGDFTIPNAVFKSAKLDISGSGEANLGGSADDFEVEISGSGDIDALDFLVKNALVSVSGSGDVQLSASQTLDVEISGSGDVAYKGNPSVTSSISGSGKIRKL